MTTSMTLAFEYRTNLAIRERVIGFVLLISTKQFSGKARPRIHIFLLRNRYFKVEIYVATSTST